MTAVTIGLTVCATMRSWIALARRPLLTLAFGLLLAGTAGATVTVDEIWFRSTPGEHSPAFTGALTVEPAITGAARAGAALVGSTIGLRMLPPILISAHIALAAPADRAVSRRDFLAPPALNTRRTSGEDHDAGPEHRRRRQDDPHAQPAIHPDGRRPRDRPPPPPSS